MMAVGYIREWYFFGKKLLKFCIDFSIGDYPEMMAKTIFGSKIIHCIFSGFPFIN